MIRPRSSKLVPLIVAALVAAAVALWSAPLWAVNQSEAKYLLQGMADLKGVGELIRNGQKLADKNDPYPFQYQIFYRELEKLRRHLEQTLTTGQQKRQALRPRPVGYEP